MELVDHVLANISDQVFVNIDESQRSIQLVVPCRIWHWNVVLEDLADLMYLSFA